MTKFLTFLTMLLVSVTLFAQNPTIPINFESTTLTYGWSDFEGGVATVINNPQSSGINTSPKVCQMVKFAGQVYGGSTLPLAGNIDFGNSNAFKMKVFANRVGAPVLFKLEGPTPVEVSVSTTVANQWEELTFSFAGFTGFQFNAITIIYDLGVMGDGGPNFTMLFDDIEFTTAGGGIQLPINFESTTLTYAFSNFAGGVATRIDNPQSSGINTSGKVVEMVKFAGEVFGGSTIGLAGPINFGANTSINMKVFTNRANAPILFKLEGAAPVEINVNTTVANQWEELTYNFAGSTSGIYTGITIIYDLGVVGDGGPNFTMLFDDIQFPGTVSTVDLNELGIEFYPNPVKNLMTFNAPEMIDLIGVYNLSGQHVFFAKPGANQSVVDLSALAPGTYVVKISMNGKEGVAKVIKQ